MALPNGYREVEYIENDKLLRPVLSFYNITPINFKKIKIEFLLDTGYPGDNQANIDRFNGTLMNKRNQENVCFIGISGANNLVYGDGKKIQGTKNTIDLTTGKKIYLLDYVNGIAKIGNKSATFTPQTPRKNLDFCVFGASAGSTKTTKNFDGRLYWFKVYEDGVLQHNYIPILSKDNKVHLYDEIGKSLKDLSKYQNHFKAGPIKLYPKGLTIINGKQCKISKPATPHFKITESMTRIGSHFGKIEWDRRGDFVKNMPITFSSANGMQSQNDIVMSGKKYRVLTITDTGTLTLESPVKADVWMVNGGNAGGLEKEGPKVRAGDLSGGGGGYVNSFSNVSLKQGTLVTVGAGGKNLSSGREIGGFSQVGDLVVIEQDSSFPSKGGSGGGRGYNSKYNDEVDWVKGQGVSTIPFNDSSFIDKPHSAGGGGAKNSVMGLPSKYYSGGNGGSNGSDGQTYIESDKQSYKDGVGGNYGGSNVEDTAKYYGGGGAFDRGSSLQGVGNGYQGIVYIRIPYDQN